MFNKKMVGRIASLLLVLAFALSACAPTPTTVPGASPTPIAEEPTSVATEATEATEVTQQPEPVTLTYYTFSAAPDHLQDLDEMIKIFEEQHQGIQIKVETAAFADYFTKLQTLVAGGTTPDVFELNYENFVTYAAKDLLLDLNPLIKADTTFDSSIFYPRALEAFKYQDMQLGLPASFSDVVLFYNKDLFDQAGVSYPSADWTWDDAIEAATKLTDPEKGVWGLYSPIQFWEFYKKATQNNCSFFNEERTEVTINSPECVQALQTMVDIVNKYKVMPTDAEMGGVSDADLFKQGKLAMFVSGIWMFTTFQDAPFQWDIQIEPGMATKAVHFFANGVSVSATTNHPQEAWEWAKFFTSSPEVAKIRVKSNWELPALNNPDYFSEYLMQRPPENRQVVFDSLEYAVVPPVIEKQNEMTDIVNSLLEQVKLGQITPQEALDQAKVQIEALIK